MKYTKTIDLLELFSGIGGFTKGFEEAGFTIKNHYYSEIDKHAISNYSHNFPNAQYVGSVTNVRKIIRIINQDRTNKLVITFGSPCQDFSMAGKGFGLAGNKSSLIKFALFLIRWLRPDVFIWENVKGAYSTNNGSDYWAIIQAFANLPNYGFEQQLVNTAWFLPQNRERIYLVGHLTGRSKFGVFPFRESDGIHFATGPDKKEVHTNSLCLTAKGNSNNTGSFVKVAHVSRTEESKRIKRESMKNGKDYSPFQGKNLEFRESDVMNTITCATQKDNLILTDIVRRLTEIECERLQGFPDDWTKHGIYNGVLKEIPKTQRYKMCGNAVTVAVVQAIAKRIKLIDL